MKPAKFAHLIASAMMMQVNVDAQQARVFVVASPVAAQAARAPALVVDPHPDKPWILQIS